MTKIVIVEDDQAISQMYRIKFEGEGYDVETAENGRIGLDVIKRAKPAIVLLDVMMPEMNGDEVLEKLRASDWGKNIKVIVLTNMGEQELAPSIREHGVEAVILKADMTPRQVAELVKRHLST